MLRASRRRIRVNRLSRQSLLLATAFLRVDRSIHFFCPEPGYRSSYSQDQSAKVAAHWDKVTGVSKTTATLQVVVNPPLRRGIADSRQRLQVAARYSGRLRSLCSLAALSEARHCRTRAAGERQNFMGLFADRSHDHRFSRGHQGPFRHSELQHDSGVDVQDRQAGHLPGRSGPAGVGLHPGHRTPRSQL